MLNGVKEELLESNKPKYNNMKMLLKNEGTKVFYGEEPSYFNNLFIWLNICDVKELDNSLSSLNINENEIIV